MASSDDESRRKVGTELFRAYPDLNAPQKKCCLCLQVTKPQISIAAAAELVTDLWGGEVVGIAQLDSYDDQNFCVNMRASLVAGSAAVRHTLKVHNGVDSANLPFIEGQNAMMARLAEKCR
jgi:hypothetical protein